MLVLYRPALEDLWFRAALTGDPDTMSYNARWGGTVPFPRERWEAWYGRWLCGGDERFYRYLLETEDDRFVGEAAYHMDPERGVYLADIVVHARDRRRGYGRAGLALLCGAARDNGCGELYDTIAADNPARGLFLDMGFTVVDEADGIVTLRKRL